MRGGTLVLVGNSGAVLTRSSGIVNAYKHPSGLDFAAVIPYRDSYVLLAGEDAVLEPQRGPVRVLGVATPRPPDGRLRRVIEFAVSLRGRLP